MSPTLSLSRFWIDSGTTTLVVFPSAPLSPTVRVARSIDSTVADVVTESPASTSARAKGAASSATASESARAVRANMGGSSDGLGAHQITLPDA